MNDFVKKNTKIYLVCGKARHGKDTFSGYLKEKYEEEGKSVLITYLSKYIKYYAREITGWDLKDDETKPRTLLQELGTELIRKKLNKETFFIDRMIEDIEILSYYYDVIIISDVRFELEITNIKKSYPDAKSILINRINFDNGLTEEQKKHSTENGLDNYHDFDEEVINTTLEELKEDARKIYMKIEKEG